jgi:hypothetical protein
MSITQLVALIAYQEQSMRLALAEPGGFKCVGTLV